MGLIFKTEKKLNDAAGIVKKICELTDVSYFDLKHTDTGDAVTARQLAIYWVFEKNKTWLSIRKIAVLFNTDRRYIKRAIEIVKNKISPNRELLNIVNDYFING